jgi:parallel beta-helix repeat protein
VTLIGAGRTLTTVDADSSGRGIYLDGAGDCRVENLKITRAFAQVYGAGLLLKNCDASVNLAHLAVTGNYDGAIICAVAASPTITDVEMMGNINKQGGGLEIDDGSNPHVSGCTISDNDAPTAAGVFIRGSSPILVDCWIENNQTTAPSGTGGGVMVLSSTPDISDCVISGNTAHGNGGGVAFMDNSTGSLTDCSITDNIADGTYSEGAGLFISQAAPLVSGCYVARNHATGAYGVGGGLNVSFTPNATLSNCTFDGNSCGPAGYGGGITCQFGAVPTIERCIIAHSTVGEALYCLGATPVISCCDLYGNAGGDALCGTDGGGNFTFNPLLCGTGLGDISSYSPCAPGNHPAGAGACGGQIIGSGAVTCSITGVGEAPPAAQAALGNEPNPFNPRTTIFFVLPEAGPVRLRILDLRGRRVASFAWDELAPGRHELPWDGTDMHGRALPSGVYLYELKAPGFTLTERMALIR